MSRHRNIRSMNYDEEYEGYDDVYGHSVEDDYAASPSMEHFLYDRNREQQMSSFLTTEADIIEEDEEEPPKDAGKVKTSLSEMDQARVNSCLDQIRDIMGESIPESEITKAILAHNFNTAAAMSALLDKPVSSQPPKPKADTLVEIPAEVRPAVKECVLPLPKKVVTTVPESPKSATPVRTVVATSKPAVKTGFLLPPAQETQGNLPAVSTDVSPAPSVPASRSTSPSLIGGDTPSRAGKRDKPAVDVEAEFERERGGGKQLLNLVVVGHVDAGKSTLMGHLLYRLGQVSQKMMHKYEQESKKLGKQSFMYAWVLDETGEERSRGITMDVAQTEFQTNSKRVTLLDAPGHKDFIPNMITGAAQADVALLVVDATSGEFETGFEFGGQTREHAILVRSLGVSQMGVAVNKLDTAQWSQARFQEITSRLKTFLKQVGFRDADVTYVPVSGLTGENLTTPPTEAALSNWYKGPTLLEVIDLFRAPERSFSKPVRLVISDVFKGAGTGGTCVAGRLESGRIASGDKLTLMPQGETAIVKNILVHDLSSLTAFAGDQAVLTISGVDPLAINVGGVLCDPALPIKMTTRIEARIVLFNIEIPITKGYPVVLHYQSLAEPAYIKKIKAEIHKGTGEVVKSRPRCLVKNTSALVEVEVGRPVCMEMYRDFRELGRFMLRAGGSTIAAGMVTKDSDVCAGDLRLWILNGM